jgi:hypothetical protein
MESRSQEINIIEEGCIPKEVSNPVHVTKNETAASHEYDINDCHQRRSCGVLDDIAADAHLKILLVGCHRLS